MADTLSALTTEIISSYVGRNSIAASELAELIRTVYNGLKHAGEEPVVTLEEPVQPSGAQIRRSVRPNGITSFIDGRSYKTLKRHLTKHGLTIAAYRERFGLPSDYPTVASEYAAKRSALALASGLGRKVAPVTTLRVKRTKAGRA